MESPVSVLWVARFAYHAGEVVQQHHHDFSQLLVVLEGRGRWCVDGVEQPLRMGQRCCLPPDVRHGLWCEQPIATLDIKFRIHNSQLATAFAALAGVGAAGDGLRAGVGDALRAARGPWAGPRTDACLSHVLWELVASEDALAGATAADIAPTATGGAEHPLIQRLLTIIRAGLAEPLAGEDLAQRCGYSYRHLAERCQALIGLSPRQVVMRERLALACQLLRYSDYPVKAVAQRCGFATVHHFTRRFSAALGMGPAAWRQQAMENEARRGIVVAPNFENAWQLTVD